MSRVIPVIFTWRPRTTHLHPGWRLLAVAVAAASLLLLLIALRLRPDSAGIGSHRQLGLSECEFLHSTGLPCPTCGMSTSFAHFVRGHLLASLYVQPMGTVLALGTAMTFWAALYIGLTGRPVHRLLRFVPARYHAFPLLALAMLAWMWKIWIHLRGAGGWGM